MRQVTFPLNLRMRGAEVAELQEALKALLANGALLAEDERSRHQLSLALERDGEQQYYGTATRDLVRCFQEERQLQASGAVDEATAALMSRLIAGLWQRSDTGFTVKGRVAHADGRPFAGGVVRAFRVALRVDEQIGEAETNEKGRYEIRYEAERLGCEEGGLDVRVRGYDRNGREVARSAIYFAAVPEESIDLVVGDEVYRGPSEYELIGERIEPFLDGADVVGLAAEQVEYLAVKAGVEAVHLAYFVRAATLARTTGIAAEALYAQFRENLPVDLPGLLSRHPEVHRAALQAAAKANLIPSRFGDRSQIEEIRRRQEQAAVDLALQTDAQPGKAALRDVLAMTVADQEEQRAFVAAYVAHEGPIEAFWDTVRADPRLRDRVDEVQFMLQVADFTGGHLPLMGEIQRLKQDNTLAEVSDLARFSEADWETMIRRDGIGVPPDVPGDSGDQRTRRYADAITRAVEDLFPTRFFAARVAESDLRDRLDLARFLDENREFALNGTRLETYLAEHPTALDVVTQDRRAEIKTQIKAAQRLAQVAPRARQIIALQKAGIDSAHAISRMAPLDFEVRYASPLGGSAQAAQIHERAEQISATAINLLANYGLAASKIALSALSDGAAAPDPAIPDWRTLFGSIDLCDCEHCRSVLGPAAYFVDILQFLKDRKLVEPLKYKTQTLSDGTKLEVLDVSSIKYKTKTTSDGSRVDLSPKDVLSDRRPDLLDIELTCANTNISLPYTDLANEVLEEAIAPLPAFSPFSLADTLVDTLDKRAVSGELVATFAAKGHSLAQEQAAITVRNKGSSWILHDLACSYTVRREQGHIQVVARGRQTSGTSEERAANPQYVNDAAYATLASQIYPFCYNGPLAQQTTGASLPFNLSIEEIRAYLNHLGVPRHGLMEALLAGDRAGILASTDVAHDYLGFTPEDAAVVTGATTSQPGATDPGAWNLWGFGDGAIPDPASSVALISRPVGGWSSSWLQVLTGRADVFLQQSGLKYIELLELLVCESVNPIVGGARRLHITSDEGETCDPKMLKLEGFDTATAAAAVRFLRLWRKLGWRMRDLDRVVLALGSSRPGAARLTPAALDEDLLVSLSHIARLQGALKIPVEQLAGWWTADLESEHLRQWWTATYIDHAASGQPTLPSPYTRLFRNKAVTNPIDTAFTEDAANLEGSRTSPETLSGHGATITAALGISAADLALLLADANVIPRGAADNTKPDDRLTLPYLVELYRHATLAKAVNLPIRDYLSVLKLLCATPFSDTASTVLFAERVASLRASGFKVAELDYLLRHRFTSASGVAPADDAIALVLDEIRAGLQTIATENAFVTDPADQRGLTGDPHGELTRKKLALLNWDSALIEEVVAMFSDSAVYEVDLPALPAGLALPNDSGAYETGLSALPNGYTFPPAVRGVVYFDKAAGKLKAIRPLTRSEQAALSANLPVTLQTAVQKLLAQPDELRGHIEHDGHTLRFTGAMTMARLARLKEASNDPAWVQAVEDLFKLPRTFAARNMRGFAVQTYTAPLVALPKKLAFPDTLNAKIYHDADEGKLHFVGAMTKTELATLKAVATDPTQPALNSLYANALDELYAAPDNYAPKAEETFLTDTDTATLLDTARTPADRFEFVLERLLTYLQRALSQRLVKQTLGERLHLEAEFVNELLLERVQSAKKASQPAIADFLDPTFVARNLMVPLTRDDFPHLFASYLRLHKIALVVSRCKITAKQLNWILDGGKTAAWTDLGRLPSTDPPASATIFEAWERLIDVCRLRDELPVGDTLLEDIFTMIGTPNGTVGNILAMLCTETQWDQTDASDLATALGYTAVADFADGQALRRLTSAFGVLSRLGMSAKQCLAVITAHRQPAAAQRDIARGVIEATRAKYDEQEWLTVARPLRNVLRDKQRAALVVYLVTHPPWVTQASGGSVPAWHDVNGLYAHFLIDVEMSTCQLTSRIKQAISSVQLFIQRCLLNLEPEVRACIEFDKRWREWKWMRNYRVWEANRKVFLYPENWIEPELRDDKSEFFTELESELQQTDLSQTSDDTGIQASSVNPVERGFEHYLEKLATVTRLDIVGMYQQQEAADASGSEAIDTLHVFGRTHDIPHICYYRRWADKWTAWEKVNIDMEGDHLIPVVWNRRLFLFWPIFTEKQEQHTITMPAEGQSLSTPRSYWEIQLAWSEYQRGTWSPKKIGKKSLESTVNVDPKAADRGKAKHVFRAKLEGDTLCVWYESFEALKFGSHVLHDYGRGEFRVRECGGDVEIGTRPVWGYSTLQGTKAEGMLLSEAGIASPLYLPGTRGGSEEPALEATPGEGKYSVLYPYQDEALTGCFPFFFQDGTRCFFVTPVTEGPNSTGSVVARADPDKINPGLAGTYLSTYWKSSGDMPLGRPPQIREVESALIRSRDPLKFVPSFEATSGSAVVDAAATRPTAPGSSPGSAKRPLGSEPPLPGGPIVAVIEPEVLPVVIAHVLQARYEFHTHYHPYVFNFIRHLNRDGIPGLLQRPVQRLSHRFFDDTTSGYQPTALVAKGTVTKDDPTPKYPREDVDFSYGGAYSLYNWELFFHVPLLIADRLSKNQCFAAALEWFHYIFDPTDASSYETPKRYWRTKPFFDTSGDDYRKQSIPAILRTLAKRGDAKELAKLSASERTELEQLEAKVKEWRTKPFQPHVIARLRTTAYQKAVVMKYLDNLIAWGDQLFRRDTIESINEATQLYIYAAEILGRRPDRFPPRALPRVQTFNTIEPKLDAFSNALVELESFVPPSAAPSSNVQPSPNGRVTLPAMLYFCIPTNDKLLAYWDTVADRLFKVRHCMNIEGVIRELPLFEPPIEPGLLVRAAAAGVDITSALNDINAAVPHYRFSVMAQKAGDLCAEVKALGAALLSALEKRDAEAMALLRSGHEVAVLKAVRDTKKQQVEEAAEALAGLQASKTVIEARRDFYGGRDFLNPFETTHLALTGVGLLLSTVQLGADIAAGVLHLIPDVKGGVPTTIGVTYGGANVGSAVQAFGSAMGVSAAMVSTAGSLAATIGSYRRRQEDWTHQADLAARELQQVDKQIAAAEIRKAIAEQELTNHDLQIENARQVDEFMHDKFTNRELYDWMVGRISSIYFQSYQLAYDVAKRAERAYRHELGLEDSEFIQFGAWDSMKKGLLAGERLFHDLKRLEVSYLDKNRREYEITKHVSLATIDPVALIKLRETGECYLSLPEVLFDLDYPGHYMRRIKSVGLTIPCVVGPYTGVSCTLTLIKHSVRKNALHISGYERGEADSRFLDSTGTTQSIATSSGQNDSGLFEVSFRDERFLPFEGAGVVSEWRLELPRTFRPFDYDTISDVVLHLRYTARDGGAPLRQAAEEQLAAALNAAILADSRQGLYRMLSVRHDFPSEWHRFLHPDDSEPTQGLVLDISPRLFPFPLRGKTIRVSRVDLLLSLSAESAVEGETSPAEAYPGGQALTVKVTPPKLNSTDFELKTDQTLNGSPHDSKDLSVEVTEDQHTWTVVAAPASIKKIAAELWEKKGSYERLKSSSIEDLVCVLRYQFT